MDVNLNDVTSCNEAGPSRLKQRAPGTEASHKFSVIIPVYNGADTLRQCLQAVTSQDYPRAHFEVIVVDDGSTDETAEIAAEYPVRLIQLPENQGRIVARRIGAEQAQHDILVFNDCRVIPEAALLRKLAERSYFPLLPDVIDYDGRSGGFSRLFYLLRRKIYYPNYPVFQKPGEILIDRDNFDRMPKGTTSLACSRSLWLQCQPAVSAKYVNDDIRVLLDMVGARPIMRTSAIRVTYLQRTSFWDVLHHTYDRGPRFVDYYLVPGRRFYRPYVFAWVILLCVIATVVLWPVMAMWLVAVGVVIVIGSVTWLSERPADIVTSSLLLPPVISAFCCGILRGQLDKWLRISRRRQAPTGKDSAGPRGEVAPGRKDSGCCD